MFRSYKKLQEQNKELTTAVQHMSEQMTFILGEWREVETSDAYVGNEFTTYSEQVKELAKMYEAKSNWGCQLTRNIIDVRSAFTIGGGVKPELAQGVDSAEAEMKFVREFIKANQIDQNIPLDLAKESEIEGKCLVKIWWSDEIKMPKVVFIPWSEYNYKVETDPLDYTVHRKVVFDDINRGKAEGQKIDAIEEDSFVYGIFGGRTYKVNDTPPKLGNIIGEIQGLDKALRDWREINMLFAKPTPVFEAEDMDIANAIHEKLASMNWRIGTYLAIGGATYALKGPDVAGARNIENEIKRRASIISGATGIPIHFLGLPEQMSNRSTADNLFELVFASTVRERMEWIGFYTKMFQLAIRKYNQNNPGAAQLREDVVRAILAEFSQQQLNNLVDIWLLLYQNDVITRETILSHVPDIDPEREKRMLEQQAEANMAKFLPKLNQSQPQNAPQAAQDAPESTNDSEVNT